MESRDSIVTRERPARMTDRYLASLKPEDRMYAVWEQSAHGLGSLGMRIYPSGKKSWVYAYGGKRRRLMTLGTYPVMTLGEAHLKAKEAMIAVDQGGDPACALVAHKAALRGASSVAEVASGYLEKHAKPNKKSWKNDEYYLNRYVLPAIGTMRAQDVRRRDMMDLIEKVAKKSKTQACRVLEITRKMFNWAIQWEILESNPCHLVPRPMRTVIRDRVLDEQELQDLWGALERGIISRDYGKKGQKPIAIGEPVRLALQLVLLTGVRRSEIELAEWTEVDLLRGWWTLPGCHTKNRLQHRVPISPLAAEKFKRLMALTGGTQFLLPGRREGVPVTLRCLTRALSRIRVVLGARHYHVHDLRRTAATFMSRAGVPRLTIKKILNHVDPDITAVYDRNSYDAEKKAALIEWEKALLLAIQCRPGEGDFESNAGRKAA